MLYDPSFIKIKIFIIAYREKRNPLKYLGGGIEIGLIFFITSYFLDFFLHDLLAHIILQHFQILLSYLDISKIFNCDKKFPFSFWILKRKRRGQEIWVCICNSGLKLQQQRFYQHKRIEVKGKEPEKIIENKISGQVQGLAVLGLSHKAACQKKKPVPLHLGSTPTEWSPPCVETPVIFSPTGGCREASMFSLKYHPV